MAPFFIFRKFPDANLIEGRNMNRHQRVVVGIGMMLILLYSLFPPFRVEYQVPSRQIGSTEFIGRGGVNTEFAPIFSPPSRQGAIDTYYDVNVDFQILSVEVVAILLLVAGGMLLTKSPASP